MPSIESHEYYSNSAPRTLFLTLEERVTISVSSRNRGFQAAVSTQDLPVPPGPSAGDFISICRVLLWHIKILLRLVLTLCVMSLTAVLTPTVRACHFLQELFLQWIDSTLDIVPPPARLLGTFFGFQIKNRWSFVWRIAHRTVTLPVKIAQAIVDSQAPNFVLPDPYRSNGTSVSLHDHIDNIAISLVRPPSLLSSHSPCTRIWHRTPQKSTAAILDNFPIFEEGSMSSYVSDGMRETLSCPQYAPHILDSGQREAISPEKPSEQQRQVSDQRHSNGPHTASSEPCKSGAGTLKGGDESALHPLQPPQKISEETSRSIYNLDETGLHHHVEISSTQKYNTVSVDAEASSVSSDFARAESFSPEQLHFAHINETKPPTESGLHFATSTQECQQGAQLLQMLPPVATTAKSQDDQHLATPGTYPASGAQYTEPLATDSLEHQQYTERFPEKLKLSSLHLGCDGASQQNDDADCCASETASCCEDPDAPKSKPSEQQQADADVCDETCFSCETCDRRHKRARRSRIPRTVRAFGQYRPRSSSFTGCYSGQTASSVGTVGRKKWQKRKAGAV